MREVFEGTISDFLVNYRYLRPAKPSDNQELIDFLRGIKLKTKDSILRQERGEDFFAMMNLLGENAYIIVFENKDRSIGGCGAIAIKRVFVNGEVQEVGYLTEIRISETLYRRARLEWRLMYADVLKNYKKIFELKNCYSFYSIIMGDNRNSLNAFTKGKRGVLYNELGKIKSVSILFRYRLRKLLSSDYRVAFINKSELSELRIFLHQESRRKTFGAYFMKEGEDQLCKRLEDWSQFDFSSFIIVRDKEGQIVGCLAPCSFTKERHYVLEKTSWQNKLISFVLSAMGNRMIREGREVKIQYLTHLEVSTKLSSQERKHIFLQMVSFLFENKINKNSNMLSFYDFPYNDFSNALKEAGFYIIENEGHIYDVRSSEIDEILDIPKDLLTHEMALC